MKTLKEMLEPNPELLRATVRSLYDAQKLRIQMSNRSAAHAKDHVLSQSWGERVMERQGAMLAVEKSLLHDVKTLLSSFPIYEWLLGVKGCGPAMSGCVISEIGATPNQPKDWPEDEPWEPRHGIARFDTVSKLWAYAGLHVIDGAAARRKKGQVANWNSFLKTKLLGVLGPCFLKSESPYRKFYDNYKVRKQNTMVDVCFNCDGRGKAKNPETGKLSACKNCAGTGGPAPWGKSDGHRHNAAIRYMVKQFISDLYVEWRTLEGLEVRPPYSEEFLGKVHTA